MANPEARETAPDQDTQRKRQKDEEILAALAQQLGHVPIPLPLVALRPGTVATLIAHRNQILEGGPLTKKEQALVALSSATAVKSGECARAHADHARKAGATEDEIVQTLLIASFVSGMSSLRATYGTVRTK